MVHFIIKDVVQEVFQDYKEPAMLIATSRCDWKCLVEKGLDIGICQNSSLSKLPNKTIPMERLIEMYLSNIVTKAVIFGGLEPILQFDSLLSFIDELRCRGCEDDVVIYTGYYLEEISYQVDRLKAYKNIILKCGRFIPDSESVFDEVLGITLASKNQYGIRIS